LHRNDESSQSEGTISLAASAGWVGLATIKVDREADEFSREAWQRFGAALREPPFDGCMNEPGAAKD
jgi:hypothetical protein